MLDQIGFEPFELEAERLERFIHVCLGRGRVLSKKRSRPAEIQRRKRLHDVLTQLSQSLVAG